MKILAVKRIRFKKIVLLILTLITGCVSSTEKDVTYNLVFEMDPQANATTKHQQRPIKIQIVQLKETSGFMVADFFTLQRDAKGLLSNDIVDVESVYLVPGTKKIKKLKSESTKDRYVGIVAEYEQFNDRKWRIVVPLPVPEPRHFYSFSADPPPELIFHLTPTGIQLAK